MILAADLGGTTIKLGLVQEGTVIARARLAAEPNRPMMERLEVIASAWESLLKQANCLSEDCQGAALALPFLVDDKRPRVMGSFGKFPGAEVVDFAVWANQRLRLPVAMENDVRLALLGEWSSGAAQGSRDVLMFAFGTGIGCAVICGNRLLRGAHNRAASLFGHSTLDHLGNEGRCGNIGCAEDLASTATLAQRALSRPDFSESKLGSAKTIDFETVVRLAAEGDSCSRSLLRDSLRTWAALVQNAVLAYDPEIILLGGGVMRSPEAILPSIEEHLRRHIAQVTLNVPVIPARLGDDAALLGGEILLKQSQSELI